MALNYHHLLCAWTVVREGGVVRAAEKLRLSQPTVSAQVTLSAPRRPLFPASAAGWCRPTSAR
jgi:hypothetical protein